MLFLGLHQELTSEERKSKQCKKCRVRGVILVCRLPGRVWSPPWVRAWWGGSPQVLGVWNEVTEASALWWATCLALHIRVSRGVRLVVPRSGNVPLAATGCVWSAASCLWLSKCMNEPWLNWPSQEPMNQALTSGKGCLCSRRRHRLRQLGGTPGMGMLSTPPPLREASPSWQSPLHWSCWRATKGEKQGAPRGGQQ